MTVGTPRSLPESIGRYRIESLLGRGGMGQVYKAYDPVLERTVALKTIVPEAEDPSVLDRLYREARACGKLQHPGIVTVYDLGDIDGTVFIAMQCLEGESLAAAMERGDLSFERRITILMEMLDALQYAHSQGVIHRDVKPSNVHLLPDHSVKLLDFGLAHLARADALTMSGAVMGTPYYMSPEQLKAQRVDARTDVYATGVVAYELLTHRRAFDGDHFTAVMLKALSDPPPPMNTSWSTTFPEIERIITRAMAKSPDDRYGTAEEMRSALSAFLSSSRDAIARAQADATVLAQRTALEARTLISEGRVAEGEALLAQTLRVNPDAYELRALQATLVKTPEAAGVTWSVSPPGEDARPSAPAPIASSDWRDRERATSQPQVSRAAFSTRRAASEAASFSRAQTTAAAVAVIAAVGGIIWSLGTPRPVGAPESSPPPAAVEPAPARPEPAAAPASTPAPAPVPVPPPAPLPVAKGKPIVPATPSPLPSEPAISAPKPAEPAPPASATKLFYAKEGQGPSTTHPGLRYRIFQVNRANDAAEVDPATVFQSGDRIRFSFESNVNGHLYVVQQGSTGRWTVIFPNPGVNGGRNAVEPFQPYLVPSEGAFRFDANPGIEKIMVFLSRKPIPDLPGFERPVTVVETLAQARVQELSTSVRARDLVFEQPRTERASDTSLQGNFVVNRAELADAVTVTFDLVHR